MIVSEGSGWYVDARYPEGRTVEAPALVWVFPGVEHGYGPARSGWTEHWVLFSGRTTLAFEQLGVWSRSTPVVELAEIPDAALELFGGLRNALADVGERTQLGASILCQRIIELATTSTGGSGGRDLLEEFASLSFTPMSVRERAERLGVSVGQLRTEIARASGHAPLDYIVELRVARACELLVETSWSIREISSRVGYDDPAYFTRLFTRRVGIPPTLFREQQSRLVDGCSTNANDVSPTFR